MNHLPTPIRLACLEAAVYLDVNPFVLGPARSEFKRCTKCGEYKPRDMFHRDKNRSDGLTPHCKVCSAKKAKAWYAANKERHFEKSKAWHDANKERYAKTHKARYEANKDRHARIMKAWYAANKEHAFENGKAWRKANPDKEKSIKLRRRAREKSLPENFTASDWQYALDHFNGCCAVCGRQPGLWHTLAADHWIPLNAPECPGTVAWNIVPLCHGIGGCNNAKNAHDPVEWLTDVFGKRKGRAILRRIEAFLEGRK